MHEGEDDADNLLSLRWNNHLLTFKSLLSSLQEKSSLSDATLACGGQMFPVHKLVLSTCSDYFLRVFDSTPCKHPVIVMQELQPLHLHYLLSYMYSGQVSVPQQHLPALIKAAETLQVKGLSVNDEETNTNVEDVEECTDDQATPPRDSSASRRHDSSIDKPKKRKHATENNDCSLLTDVQNHSDHSPSMKSKRSKQRNDSGLTYNSSRRSVSPRNSTSRDNNDSILEEHSNKNKQYYEDHPADHEDIIGVKVEKVEVLDDNTGIIPVTYPNTDNSWCVIDNKQSHHWMEQDSAATDSAVVMQDLLLAGLQDESSLQHQNSFNTSSLLGSPAMSVPSQGSQCYQSGSAIMQPSSQSHDRNSGIPSSPPPSSSAVGGSINKATKQLFGRPSSYHSDVNTHMCPMCPKSFQSRADVVRHMRTHTGERPYKCPHCQYSAALKGNLKSHIISRHSDQTDALTTVLSR